MTDPVWHAREVSLGGETLPYRVRPAPAGADASPPAILFLHGRGESGRDNEAQLRQGLPRFATGHPDAWPFLIVAPQKPEHDRLWPDHAALVGAMLEAVAAEFPHDASRRFITGLSQGGNGTMTLAAHLPWRFAAAAPVCGWADPRRAARELAGIPLWLFHGSDDAVVPASCSRAVADWLTLAGHPPRLTLYPGVAHDAWDPAYGPQGDGPDLAAWFLSQPGGARA